MDTWLMGVLRQSLLNENTNLFPQRSGYIVFEHLLPCKPVMGTFHGYVAAAVVIFDACLIQQFFKAHQSLIAIGVISVLHHQLICISCSQIEIGVLILGVIFQFRTCPGRRTAEEAIVGKLCGIVDENFIRKLSTVRESGKGFACCFRGDIVVFFYIRHQIVFDVIIAVKLLASFAIIEKAPTVHEYSVQIANYLRKSLSYVGKQITLEKEFSFLEDYVAIQKLRFGSRITFELDCDAECSNGITFVIPYRKERKD